MRQHPDSSRALEGGRGGDALPQPSKSAYASDMPSSAQATADAFVAEGGEHASGPNYDDRKWLLTAQQCFADSRDFFDANLRKTVEESMDLYRSKHPAGSKYNLPSFQKRSRLFRPKTRSAMRYKEAAIGEAFFGTTELVAVRAVNEADPQQELSAKVQQKVLSTRMESKEMAWFPTVIGGFQDASRQGFVVAKTEWEFSRSTQYFDVTTSDGKTTKEAKHKVKRDTPRVILIPCENLRVAPNCDWIDPINSSEYLIELMPMSINAVMEMMANPQSAYRWRDVTIGDLMSGTKQDYDSVRQNREGNREDRYEKRASVNEYSTTWIHKNIVRIEGEDYVYLTIGVEKMLTDPMPLSELDPRGYRGYLWGYTCLEAHNPYPQGEVQIAKPVQEEINEVANMRADAIKMATIGRYFTKRGAAIDTEALVRFVPGSSIDVTDTAKDVRWDKAPDVGRGAFEEQNLLTTEMSDLLGVFQGNEISSNRKLNETVGGMELLNQATTKVTEYTIRTYSETFVEEALRQVLDLICIWETDTTLAYIVGDELGISAKEYWDALEEPQRLIVNVGYGATNPESRIRRMQIGMAITKEIAPEMLMTMDKPAFISDVFAAVGFRNPEKYFPVMGAADPDREQLAQENAQYKQMLEQGQQGDQSKVQVAQIAAEARVRVAEMTLQEKAADREAKALIERAKQELAMIDLRLRYEQNEIARQELYLQREALSHTISMAERQFALTVATTQMTQQNTEMDRAERGQERADAKEERASKEGQKRIPDASPPGVAQLVKRLQSPASGPASAGPMPSGEAMDTATGAPDMAGDEAGVVARGNFGAIPGAEG